MVLELNCMDGRIDRLDHLYMRSFREHRAKNPYQQSIFEAMFPVL